MTSSKYRGRPLTRSGALRATKRMRAVSRKRRSAAWKTAYDAEYAAVDARSGNLCELADHPRHPGVDRNHLFKPRTGSCERCGVDHLGPHHRRENILKVCRAGHREFERAFAKGRRVPTTFNAALGRYETAIIYAADKFVARATGAV